ncbi:hypothetical protein EHS25_008841 [Saitozyma podzolica]|uniref:Vacuolar protein n=1 Tax=Saitozyma podzolica TaxID=1890683 RepID=A0A427YMX9_9TREE|nr:hypothetical protein EHS25_008841 [Saitozyma podzolica]
MCCEADWKREVVPDHKFDFVNVREFHKTDFLTRLKYIWRYILLIKSMAVYGLDIFTAVTMISSNNVSELELDSSQARAPTHDPRAVAPVAVEWAGGAVTPMLPIWTNAITRQCDTDCAFTVKFTIAKWVFVGCIIFSFLLLAYECWKAKQNYDNFCLFCQIDSSAKKTDNFAFFIFFTFKGWKRLLLADGPRQSINGIILFSFGKAMGFETNNIPAYWNNDALTAMLLFSMIATVLIFAGSLILLIAAAVLYVPFLCYIQGNLKEYVCHKVDKRIAELIKRMQKQRVKRAAALENKMAREGIRNSHGDIIKGTALQPTLPNVGMDDDDLAMKAQRKAERAGMSLPKRDEYDDTGIYPGRYEYEAYNGYPPTVDYNQPYPGGFAADDYGSTTRLAGAAAPMGISYPPLRPPSPAAPMRYQAAGGPNSYAAVPSLPPSRSQTNFSTSTYNRPLSPSYDYPQQGPPSAFPNSSSSRSLTGLQSGPSRSYTTSPSPAPMPSRQASIPMPAPQPVVRRPSLHYGEPVSSPTGMSSLSGSSRNLYGTSTDRGEAERDRDYEGARPVSGLAYDDPTHDALGSSGSSSEEGLPEYSAGPGPGPSNGDWRPDYKR